MTGQHGKRILSHRHIGIGGFPISGRGCVRRRGATTARAISLCLFGRTSTAPLRGGRAPSDAANPCFVVCSKTFNHSETLGECAARAALVLPWQSLGDDTCRPAFRLRFDGNRPTVSKIRSAHRHRFPAFWDWWAGRYSMIGDRLVDHAGIGPDNFQAMLSGFRAMA